VPNANSSLAVTKGIKAWWRHQAMCATQWATNEPPAVPIKGVVVLRSRQWARGCGIVALDCDDGAAVKITA